MPAAALATHSDARAGTVAGTRRAARLASAWVAPIKGEKWGLGGMFSGCVAALQSAWKVTR